MSARDLTGHEANGSEYATEVIYIVGPRKLQNELLASFLEEKTDARCVASSDFTSLQGREQPDPANLPLVLLDCYEKDFESILAQIEATGRDVLSKAHVALFNVDPNLSIEEEAVMRGVKGFFYESDSPEPLLKGVRAIFDGEFWVSRVVMSKCIVKQKKQGRVSPGATTNLTPREIEILAMVAIGVKNEEIADKLFISPHTVKTHIYNIFKKIGVPNRLQAALWAAKHL
jgi:LuxR family transcriptional regulator of csgAB operon